MEGIIMRNLSILLIDNGVINTGDVILLSNYVGYPGYSLNCT